MSHIQLRDYQESFVASISRSLGINKRIVAQLSTGGGKTICFAAICTRYLSKAGRPVLILVHRKELLKQAVNSLRATQGITAQPIIAGMKVIPAAQVYVAMIETAHRRIDQLTHIAPGLVIIDECHLGNFTKIIEPFSHEYIIGFTATPLAAKKTQPLRNYFNDIVCGIDIPQLIDQGHLCQNITYAPAIQIERSKLKMSMGDFDEKQMALEFSNPVYIKSTVDAYEQFSLGRKTIVFNCNIKHSELVTSEFISRGHTAMHIDGESTDREDALKWFNNTPDAILCNIGIATTGFDQPDIETVIVNKATLSLPLWLQMCGRGGRPHEIKRAFTIIDMGANVQVHGEWSASRDWIDIFRNPPKKGNGTAPVKMCPECSGFIHTRKKQCDLELPFSDPIRLCGYVFPEKEIEEEQINEFMMVTSTVDIHKLIEQNNHYKQYYTFFQIPKIMAAQAVNYLPKITDDSFDHILSRANEKGREWCKASGKRFNEWHRDKMTELLQIELTKYYPGWKKHLSPLTGT